MLHGDLVGDGVSSSDGMLDGIVMGVNVGDSMHGVEAKHAWFTGMSTASPLGNAGRYILWQ